MDHSAIETILVFLGAGGLSIAAAKLLRISPILGFFVAGAIVGPEGAHFLDESGNFEVLAELGVAFLLFDIGTHLSFRKLWRTRRDLLGIGLVQVAVTGLLLTGIAALLGLDWFAAGVIGAGFTLSSTALVLQALKDRGERGSPLERKAVSLLVFQDIFVVLLLVVLPAASGGDSALLPALAMALGNVAIALAAISAIGHLLLQPLFRWITATNNDELFTFSALGFVVAIAWGGTLLGLSMPLGAFFAGLAISESRYSYLVRAEVAPFRGLLLSLFFLSVGMSLSIDVFVELPLVVAGLTLLLITTKTVALWAVGRTFGLGNGFSLRFGLTLSQASEFAFVLLGLALTLGVITPETEDVAAAVVGVSLAVTPLLVRLAARAGELVEREQEDEPTEPENRGKVVIVGFTDTAELLARILIAADVPYAAFTSDRDRIATGRCRGFEVDFGSPDRPRAIGMTTVGEAACLVVFAPGQQLVRDLIAGVRKVNAELPIWVATAEPAFFEELSRMNLRDALILNDNTAYTVGRGILLCIGRPEPEIDALLDRVREDLARSELVPSLR